ncbi:MAG: dicarboxylate/amino acid:cation symporter [Pseudomonadota bacterium]
MNLTVRILIGMGAGLVLGLLVQSLSFPPDHVVQRVFIDGFIDAGGTIFINSLRLMVVPLVFVSLVCGAASLGRTGNIGRLGGKTLGLYLLTTAIAVTIALTLAIIISPGAGSDIAAADLSFEAREAPSLKDTFVNIMPTNPVAAMANGAMLQIITFALLFGIALSRSGAAGDRLFAWFTDANEIMMQLITMLIALAPIGVFCLMTELFSQVGAGEIIKLGQYFLTVVLALAVHMLLVYPTLLTVFAQLSPVTFLRKLREPMLVGFSTSSSGATLPVTLRTVTERVGVQNEVASFAVPLGATINMDGTAIMQGVATVFIAQFYGVDLGVGDYVSVVLTATLASVGTAAAPGVGLIMLTLVLTQVGLPVDGIMLIIGVDRLLDMMRTAVNVTGDAMVSTVIAKSEGLLDLDVFNDPDAGNVFEEEHVEGASSG